MKWFDLEWAPGYRRNEIAAHLTDSCEVLIDRAWVWRDIYAIYFALWKKGEILSFFELIQPELDRTVDLCSSNERFRKIAGKLHLYAAREYAVNGRGDQLKKEIKKAFTYLDPASKNYSVIKAGL